MKIRAICKSERLPNKHYKYNKAYNLDFNIVYTTIGSFKICIEIEKCSDFEGKTRIRYSSLKQFLEYWEVI